MPKGHHKNQLRASMQHRWKPGGQLASNGYVKVRVGKSHRLADPRCPETGRLLPRSSDLTGGAP